MVRLNRAVAGLHVATQVNGCKVSRGIPHAPTDMGASRDGRTYMHTYVSTLGDRRANQRGGASWLLADWGERRMAPVRWSTC